MWLTSFTTRQGNICVRFGSRVLNVQACAAAKGITELARKHPSTVGAIGVLLPILIQLYLASRDPRDKLEGPNRSRE